MTIKKYPVGTSIKYLGSCPKCNGKIGKVVVAYELHCYIVLPQSGCSTAAPNGRLMSSWENIEPINTKGQQLLFPFMSATDGT